MNLSGKFAVIVFGIIPVAFLLWAIGVPSSNIVVLFFIAAFLIIFFMPSEDSKKD